MLDQQNPASAPLLVLQKITDILDAFSLSHPELSMGSIREATGLPTSTVQRLVGNLVAHGFLDRTQNGYKVGTRMSYWSASASQSIDVVEAVKPVLKGLRDELGETACFFQSSMTYRVCTAMAETPHMIRSAMRVGRILPLHAGSAGRVLLAWDEDLAEKALTVDLDAITESTITDAQALREAIDRTRIEGFAITTGERESGASGLSAPVFNAQADLIGALTVMGPAIRMPREVCDRWVERLLEAAEYATRMMGGQWPGQHTASFTSSRH